MARCYKVDSNIFDCRIKKKSPKAKYFWQLEINIFTIFHYIFYVPVNTIALAKPEKARMVESMLIQMAQTGQIQGKVQGVNLFE